jgi:hypothetical protein
MKAKENKENEHDKNETPESLEKANFLSIVLRMATGSYISLGLVEDPITGKKNKDLEMAKYLIDSLRILKNKTKGNLNKEEQGYLNNIIQDLELKFVKEKE